MRSMQLVALPLAVLGIAGLARGDVALGVPFLAAAVALLVLGRDETGQDEAR
jgi:hypothetical protein